MAVAVVGQREGLASPLPPFLEEEFLARSVHGLSLGQQEASSPNSTDISRIDDPDLTQSPDRAEEEDERETFGLLEYGCSHYRRRCRIRAPCCEEIFHCRHCHNEAKSKEGMQEGKCQDLPVHGVESVICSICSTEQEVQQFCQNCGVCMGEYFCAKCRFYDDDTSKGQYHCDDCGICRTGGRDNFFHCLKCGCCLTTALQKSHICVEMSMHHNCPVCMEYLFDSRKRIEVLRCGHTIHLHCLREMQKRSQFSCPICSKSTCDLTHYWQVIDQEVAATPMPEVYRNRVVSILCNDCSMTGTAAFHIIGHKCANCNSYNTRQTMGGS